MPRKQLYLEQRIEIVRMALDCKSLYFQRKLPKEYQNEFKQYIWDMLGILIGIDEDGLITKRLEEEYEDL